MNLRNCKLARIITVTIAALYLSSAYAQQPTDSPDELIRQLSKVLQITSCTPLCKMSPDTGIGAFELRSGERASISYDGKQLLYFGCSENYEMRQTFLINLETGSVRVVKRKGYRHSGVDDYRTLITFASWDPKQTSFFYGTSVERLKINDKTHVLDKAWYLSSDDFAESEVKGPFAVTEYCQPSIDGEKLLLTGLVITDKVKGDAVVKNLFVTRTGKVMIQKIPYQAYFAWLSPDGKNFVWDERDTKSDPIQFCLYNMDTGVSRTLFNMSQVRMTKTKPNSWPLNTPCWLPDSSGFLFNVPADWNGRNANEIWMVTNIGEVQRLACGGELIANSPDAKYWLFKIGTSFYRMTAKVQ